MDAPVGRIRRLLLTAILAIAYLAVLAPVAIAARLCRRDPLGLRLRRRRGSLWLPRADPDHTLEAARAWHAADRR